MKRRLLIFTVSLAAVSAMPEVVHACRVSAMQTPILHQTLPTLPDGAIAAHVEIITDVRSSNRPPLEARIISMIVGTYYGTKLRVEPKLISSCDGFPYPGSRGIIVGRVLSSSEEALVVDPIRAPSGNELRKANERPSIEGKKS